LFQGQSVSNHLSDQGVNVVEVGQGFQGQGPPMREFERMWLGRQIHHGGHPILRWMADNVEVKQGPGVTLKIMKPNSKNDPRKVDGIQAIVHAVDQATRDMTKPVEYSVFSLGGS
jgi:phage terminase large subunit-like protein